MLTAASARPSPGRMLVVDDDAVIANMLQRYFTAQGFVVDEATALDPALELAEKEHYVLVLSDLRLAANSQGAEGLELVRRIRARSESTGILVLTAYADAQTVDDALRLGADRVLQKPQTFKEMVRIIAEVIEARSLKGIA